VSWFDLHFQGHANRIASAVLSGTSGVAIVDPGPSTCMARLEDALADLGTGLDAVTHVLLTHIHLDHAGAVGSIVRRHPTVRVVVHARGAPHLVDPTKLLQSAGRLYGDDMERLWGRCEPVPRESLDVVEGGESMSVAGRLLRVAYTPGHASHHVSYFDRATGVAWVGDTAGVCVGNGYVLPPTPPPDVDLEAWKESLALIERWRPGSLFLTHCGVIEHPRVHLQELAHNLDQVAAWVRESLERPGTDEERRAAFEALVRRELRRSMREELAADYESAAGFGLSWLGLARYWRRRSG
jgi:glyoxylase-like metal-dependent hydrolase (beta-lactamase superfamily II)